MLVYTKIYGEQNWLICWNDLLATELIDQVSRASARMCGRVVPTVFMIKGLYINGTNQDASWETVNVYRIFGNQNIVVQQSRASS